MRAVLTVIVLIAAGIAAWWFLVRPAQAPAPQAQQPSTARTVAELPPRGAEDAVPNPSFDIVRIDSNGVTVAAGRADPGSRVTLRLNGVVIAEADADANGEWSVVLTDPLPPGDGELTLEMRTPDGELVASTQTVVVSVPESGEPLIVLGEPGRPTRVLQGVEDGLSAGPLSLDSVDYGDTGAVIFAGRATPGATVRVLAGGDAVGETVAGAGGEWTLTVDAALPPGVYDLQIDMIEDGRVTAVITLPFQRVEADMLAGGQIVVQPGNSLWRIARRVYGEGPRYTVIYEANAAQIRDPDLIYPGQVLLAPDVN
jgi:nucleoid-associated protein YgaU